MRRPDALILLIGLAAAGPLAARADPTPEEKLGAVQRSLDESRKQSDALSQAAKAQAAQLAQLQAQSVAAAKSAQQNEAALTDAETRLAALQQDEARQNTALAGGEAREQALLAALERLASSPPAAMAFAPAAPVDAARSGMLMGAAVPAMEAELKSLQAALANLQQTRQSVAAAQAALAARQAALEADQARIGALVTQKQTLVGDSRAKADAAQKRVAALAAQAADLQQLVDRLAREREAAAKAEAAKEAAAKDAAAKEEAAKAVAKPVKAMQPPVQDASAAPPSAGHGPGRLLLPVAGSITKRFGDAEEAGAAKGLTIRTRPQAQIVAPAAGTIEFAGPFKGYGQILIIDHGDGYHSLLAGIGRIEGTVGQRVAAGEPVGVMASDPGADGAASLYMELRRQGQAVNPLPFLAAQDGKASG